MDGRTETTIIKRTWVPTAAGASVRESAFAEKTLVMFDMVRGRAPLCYGEQRELRVIKSSAERELVEKEGKVEVPGRKWTTIMPKGNKAHQANSLIFHSGLSNITVGSVSPPRATHQCSHCPGHGICTLSYSRPFIILNSWYDPSFKFIWVKS